MPWYLLKPRNYWEGVTTDSKINVGDSPDSTLYKAHFAAYDPMLNEVIAWIDGKTSFTANAQVKRWRFGQLSEE